MVELVWFGFFKSRSWIHWMTKTYSRPKRSSWREEISCWSNFSINNNYKFCLHISCIEIIRRGGLFATSMDRQNDYSYQNIFSMYMWLCQSHFKTKFWTCFTHCVKHTSSNSESLHWSVQIKYYWLILLRHPRWLRPSRIQTCFGEKSQLAGSWFAFCNEKKPKNCKNKKIPSRTKA